MRRILPVATAGSTALFLLASACASRPTARERAELDAMRDAGEPTRSSRAVVAATLAQVGILEDAAIYRGEDPVLRRIAKYYATCMDEDQIEKSGLAPLRSLFARIDAARHVPGVVSAISELHRNVIWAGVGLIVRPEFADATRMGLELDQGGLDLPDRDIIWVMSPRWWPFGRIIGRPSNDS
jgi:hypothetical protein